MIVAHGNGTPNSDVSEARALARVFGADMPPVTGFKWAFGHLLAAAGLIEAVAGDRRAARQHRCRASRHWPTSTRVRPAECFARTPRPAQ